MDAILSAATPLSHGNKLVAIQWLGVGEPYRCYKHHRCCFLTGIRLPEAIILPQRAAHTSTFGADEYATTATPPAPWASAVSRSSGKYGYFCIKYVNEIAAMVKAAGLILSHSTTVLSSLRTKQAHLSAQSTYTLTRTSLSATGLAVERIHTPVLPLTSQAIASR